MARHHKPDPYCAFKDDQERRKALRSRDISRAVIVISIALLSAPWTEALAWLRHIL